MDTTNRHTDSINTIESSVGTSRLIKPIVYTHPIKSQSKSDMERKRSSQEKAFVGVSPTRWSPVWATRVATSPYMEVIRGLRTWDVSPRRLFSVGDHGRRRDARFLHRQTSARSIWSGLGRCFRLRSVFRSWRLFGCEGFWRLNMAGNCFGCEI